MDAYFLSCLILFIAMFFCVAWNLVIHFRRLKKSPVFNPMNVFTVCVFFSFMILFLPNAYKGDGNNYFFAVISAFFDTMDSIAFGNRLSDMLNRVLGENYNTETYWRIAYTCFISLLAPLLTTRTVFLIFRDWFTQIRVLLNIKDSLHIFSELNDKSITVAKDIAAHEKNSKIVFTGIGKKGTDSFFVEQARTINALLTKKTLNGFKISDKISKKRIYLYFITKSEKENIKYSLDKFNEIKSSKRETVVYVFSKNNSSERVIDLANSSNSNPNVKMVLFNTAQRIAYNLFYEHPLYDVDTDNKKINVMVLGSGHNGLEFAKVISWSSQMLNYNFSVKVFDKEAKNHIIGFPFNGLSEKLSSVGTKLDLEFYDCDIFSDKFDSLRFDKADYVTIDIGDDNSNLSAALHIKELYARKKTESAYVPSPFSMPKIITVIEDAETKKIVEALNDPAIVPYGTMIDVFTLENILNWKIDKIGEFLHACYYSYNIIKNNAHKDFNLCKLISDGINDYSSQSELNKRSSRAAAIHSKYKFHDIGVDTDADSLFSEKNDELLRIHNKDLLKAEHDRWNVFQMLDGWEPWDKDCLLKGTHRLKSAKLHAYLAEFDNLKSIAEYIYGKDEDPIEYDLVIISSMRLALDYADKGFIDEKKTIELLEGFKSYIEEKKDERIPTNTN